MEKACVTYLQDKLLKFQARTGTIVTIMGLIGMVIFFGEVIIRLIFKF